VLALRHDPFLVVAQQRVAGRCALRTCSPARSGRYVAGGAAKW
jgi:hypothetical protein